MEFFGKTLFPKTFKNFRQNSWFRQFQVDDGWGITSKKALSVSKFRFNLSCLLQCGGVCQHQGGGPVGPPFREPALPCHSQRGHPSLLPHTHRQGREPQPSRTHRQSRIRKPAVLHHRVREQQRAVRRRLPVGGHLSGRQVRKIAHLGKHSHLPPF